MPSKKIVTKTTKPKSSLKQATEKQSVKKKSDFDVDAFVFEVEISKIEDWVKGMCIELDDPEFEWPSYDEQYWLGRWLTDLPYYRAHNIQKTLVSARESAILGLYDKTQKKKGAKK
jgi:hypothetical protein